MIIPFKFYTAKFNQYVLGVMIILATICASENWRWRDENDDNLNLWQITGGGESGCGTQQNLKIIKDTQEYTRHYINNGCLACDSWRGSIFTGYVTRFL